MRYLIAIPYTLIQFSTSKKKRREVCIDSFAIAHLSDVLRVSLITYACKSVTKFRLESQRPLSAGIKVLKREVASYDVLRMVVDAYRKLSSEALSIRRDLKLSPTYPLMFWLLPSTYAYGKVEEKYVRFSRVIVSSLLLEGLLGRETLAEDPIVRGIEEFSIGLLAEVNGETIKFLGKDTVVKIYNKLVSNDLKYRKALLSEVMR
ncbi:MAG TPA: hypothetical protein ENG05_03425 [Acidilobales archaeon]|nr:hypothetical protein [Acidilobales archaeon]